MDNRPEKRQKPKITIGGIISRLFHGALFLSGLPVIILTALFCGSLMGAVLAIPVALLFYYGFSASSDTIGTVIEFFMGCGIVGVFIYGCVSTYNTVYDKDEEDENKGFEYVYVRGRVTYDKDDENEAEKDRKH